MEKEHSVYLTQPLKNRKQIQRHPYPTIVQDMGVRYVMGIRIVVVVFGIPVMLRKEVSGGFLLGRIC